MPKNKHCELNFQNKLENLVKACFFRLPLASLMYGIDFRAQDKALQNKRLGDLAVLWFLSVIHVASG
jgi:hypothetical protein